MASFNVPEPKFFTVPHQIFTTQQNVSSPLSTNAGVVQQRNPGYPATISMNNSPFNTQIKGKYLHTFLFKFLLLTLKSESVITKYFVLCKKVAFY